MYLAFKEKLYSLKDDEGARRRFIEKLQIYVVASFWVLLTVFLLYLGHEKENALQVKLPKVARARPLKERALDLNSMKR